MIKTEEQLTHALEDQELLAREMSHRLKNLFAVTAGLISLSAKATDTKDAMAELLSGRLHALASAHALVRRGFRDVGSAPRTASLADLIREVVRPHELPGTALTRFSIEGPHVTCGDHSINAVALLIHELATNAAKYGALKHAAGQVVVRWDFEGDKLVLRWAESGGPVLDGVPADPGFGTKLAERTVAGQFNGTLAYDWRPSGLAVTVTLVAERLAA